MEKYKFNEDTRQKFLEFSKSINEFIFEDSLTIERLNDIFNNQGYFSGVHYKIFYDSELNDFYKKERY